MSRSRGLFSARSLGFGVLVVLLVLLVFPRVSRAGGGGAEPIAIPRASITAKDLGVIIAQGNTPSDLLSQEIGHYYAKVRGIPAANVIQVPIDTSSGSISDTDFAAIKAEVDSLLPANVQATLLTWTWPFVVAGASGSQSITSAMAFGYGAQYAGKCTVQSTSPYFDSNSTTPWQDFHMRPSMMLGESTFAAAKALIDRGVSSDGTYPTGVGYLLNTSDTARDVRAPDFAPLPALWAHPNGLTLNYLNQDYLTGANNVLFYFTGFWPGPSPSDLTTNTFVPGAVGDNLTSYAGVLPNGYLGQNPATDFLDAGATGTYGTVDEPCAYTQKFPQASVLIDQYYRGATLIEAYWKSVQWPGLGLFLGEPLARPFADQPSSQVENGQYVISTRSFRSNSRYQIQYRPDSSSPWTVDSDFAMTYDQPITWRAPVAPSGDQTRLAGPCPASPTLNTAGVARVQGGRPQTVDLQLSIDEGAGGCGPDTYDVSVEPLNDGLTASLDTTSLRSFSAGNPGPKQYGQLQISIPAAVGQSTTTNTLEPVNIDITNQRTGQLTRTVRDIIVFPTTAAIGTGFFQPHALRIIQPGNGWVLTDQPARPYEVPVALDVAPSSGITSVQLLFEPNPPSGCCTYQTTISAPNSTAQLTPPSLQPGASYTLIATGYDSTGTQVAQTSVNLMSSFTLPGP